MATSDLHIDELKETFGVNIEFTTADILAFYRRFQPDVPASTVNWRVYELVKTGMLERTGRGKFIIGSGIPFNLTVRPALVNLSGKIKAAFPYIKYCIWESEMLRGFQQHLSFSKFILVDVEKDAAQAIFDFLKERYPYVWLKPDATTMDRYILTGGRNIIVRHLISEAPIQVSSTVPTVTIEKMLVDLFTDNEFDYLRGEELRRICVNAWNSYSVNLNKLLRYASRKGQREELQAFLEKNNFTKKRFNPSDLKKYTHP
ncbi:MAG TPA: DUF6577 family protein [Puia sp.]|nr:DUF6577 family protein [Puia sp.]